MAYINGKYVKLTAELDSNLASYKNSYDAAVTYEINEIVSYSDHYYVCKKQSAGNAPTDTEYWNLLV